MKLGEAAAEEALGIPDRGTFHAIPSVNSPTPWEFGVHEHDADRRGLHLDLRLGDPDTGHAHSWALAPDMPKPGESTWAIQQPTHTLKYMDFKGRIDDGYGKGDVKLIDRDKAEVLNSTPDHLTFAVYRGRGPEEYTLHRIHDKMWKLYNRTLTRDKAPELPLDKPKYKEKNFDALVPADDDTLWSAKIDDAHNLFFLPKNGRVRVLSYRPTDRAAGLIEHTHKVESLHNVWTPSEISGTVLRGGLYAISPETNKAVPNHILAGMLNSGVWKSRQSQDENGKLVPVIYDVVMYRGRQMSDAPYGEKLKVLEEVNKVIPVLSLPKMARTPEEKQNLKDEISSQRLPETREGLVVWHMTEPGLPTKAKITKEHDVYVHSIFPGEGRLWETAAGGFNYSHEPDGPIAGKVGTGFTDVMRRDMWENKDKYKGMVAILNSQDKFDSGALRAPAFIGWHLDKNEQTKLDQVKHASLMDALRKFVHNRDENPGSRVSILKLPADLITDAVKDIKPPEDLGKTAAHAHDRMKLRSDVDPSYVDTINKLLKGRGLPRMPLHHMLPDGAVMQLIPIGKYSHVVATIMPKGTRPKGMPLGAIIKKVKIPEAPIVKKATELQLLFNAVNLH